MRIRERMRAENERDTCIRLCVLCGDVVEMWIVRSCECRDYVVIVYRGCT
jgi:hypothetical protein